MDSPNLRSCPFCAHEKPALAAVGRERVEKIAVICPECGAVGPMVTRNDPPGHAEFMWNQRDGVQ